MDDLSSHTFDQLTKLKLAEIERLREVIAKQIETDGGAHNIKVRSGSPSCTKKTSFFSLHVNWYAS